MNKKRIKKITIVLTILTVVAVLFTVLKSRNSIKSVEVVIAEKREITKAISSSGETEVIEDFVLLAPISGTVKKSYFKSGDLVKEGDLVLELDAQALSSAAQTNFSSYIETKNTLNTLDQKIQAANADVSYYLKLRDEAWRAYMGNNGNDIKQRYKLAEANYLDTVASLRVLEEQKASLEQSTKSTYQAYANAQSNVSKTKFLAPASGNLALNNIQANTYVTAGQEVLSITNSRTLVFKAYVDEADVRLIKEGMRATINLDAYPELFLKGKVDKIDSKVSILPSGSSVINATITFENTSIKPIVGLNGSAEMEIEKVSEYIAIPAEALFDEAGNTYVFTLENGLAIKTKVTKAIEGDDFIGISEGLSEGSTIIIGPDLNTITDGLKVQAQTK